MSISDLVTIGANATKDNTATINPTVSDDSSAGYSIGSQWVNTTSNTVYLCVDSSAAAAVWKEITQNPTPTDNLAGTADPTVTDDSSAGYSIGSTWVNTVASTVFICVDATANTAVWHQTDAASSPIIDNASSGYMDIGAMRIQWGADTGGTATRTITFPVAFANISFVFVATPKSGSAATTTGNIAFTESGGSRSTTQVVGEVVYTGGAVAARAGEIVEWIAIGRK